MIAYAADLNADLLRGFNADHKDSYCCIRLTPVIAFGKGGALETVRGLDHEKPTGLFFSEQSMTAIINAVKLLEEKYSAFTPDAFKENVSRFTSDIFREKLTRFVATRE